jgi:hypothetical protein
MGRSTFIDQQRATAAAHNRGRAGAGKAPRATAFKVAATACYGPHLSMTQ